MSGEDIPQYLLLMTLQDQNILKKKTQMYLRYLTETMIRQKNNIYLQFIVEYGFYFTIQKPKSFHEIKHTSITRT